MLLLVPRMHSIASGTAFLQQITSHLLDTEWTMCLNSPNAMKVTLTDKNKILSCGSWNICSSDGSNLQGRQLLHSTNLIKDARMVICNCITFL